MRAVRFIVRRREIAGCLLAALVSGSCTHFIGSHSTGAPTGSGLADAEAWLHRANHAQLAREDATACRLRAAEIAWSFLDTDGGTITNIHSLPAEQQRALGIMAEATEGITANFVGSDSASSKRFDAEGFSYTVKLPVAKAPETFDLSQVEASKPARLVAHKLCREWHTEDGAGSPCAPKWKQPSHLKRFVAWRSFTEPLTTVLSFDGSNDRNGSHTATLTAYDPTALDKVKLGNTTYPLAADFTAPIVEQTNDIKEVTIALRGLVHPGNVDCKLLMLEPYDPKRIPVLLVHGLNSHPRMWRDVYNDLRADPDLRGRYQFMLFYYPTAWPISYSSMRLREELTAWESTVGNPRNMVLIGHSMGGLLSRMQVITPGRVLWDEQWGNDADRMFARVPANNLTKRMLLFSPDRHIGREIYICTPQRGSGLADLSATSLLIRVLRLPSTITSAFIDLPGNFVDRGQLTSIAGLSPSNPLFKGLAKLPIEVPHHSIIGDRGKHNGLKGGDGVVAYWSSHLDSAESEVIVDDNHGAYQNPKAIAEVRRILLLHAGIKDTRKPKLESSPR